MLLIENVDQRSKDYSDIKDKYRPGHAGYTYDVKYGIHDYRGGGRASARETAARVAAGAIARKIVPGLIGARRAGADGPAQDRPRALGLERGRQQPVLLPGRQAGQVLRGISRRRAQVRLVGRRGDRGGGGRRAGRARRAGLCQARRRSRRRADGHQRGQRRRDRRRFCRRRACAARTMPTRCAKIEWATTASRCSCPTMPAAFSAAFRPGSRSSRVLRSSRPRRS